MSGPLTPLPIYAFKALPLPFSLSLNVSGGS
jgi:hypothetical protein